MKDLSKFVALTYRRTRMYYAEHFKKFGISQSNFIERICENEGLTQDELSQLMFIDKSTVAKSLSRLEKNGFIARKGDLKNRHAFNIFPTEKAISIYPQILEIKDEWHHKMTENLSDIERDVFEKLMEKVMENSINNCK